MARNVGWLDGEHGFRAGAAPEGFAEALARLCADHPRARTRGVHACELPHPGAEPDYPLRVMINERAVTLGSAEVRVVAADGRWLAAPDLVCHYVRDHRYLPPVLFVEAVLAGRVAPESGATAGPTAGQASGPA